MILFKISFFWDLVVVTMVIMLKSVAGSFKMQF